MFGPDIFTLDDVGYATVDAAEVPARLEEAVVVAAARCPERAIVVEHHSHVPSKRGPE
jgi:ferredoxin